MYLNTLRDKGIATSSIWSRYSMVNSFLRLTLRVNIMETTPENKKMLAQWSKNDSIKKSEVLSKAEFDRYLNEASNNLEDVHLVKKVALIVGGHGLLRGIELKNMKEEAFVRSNIGWIASVQRRKQKGPMRTFKFFISDPLQVEILDLYFNSNGSLPKEQFLRRTGKNGRGKQVLGKNAISGCPAFIAQWLGIKTFKKYTGHMFRRLGATLVVDGGGSILQLKEAGGWSSDAIAESYVAQSSVSKTAVAHSFHISESEGVVSTPTSNTTNTPVSEQPCLSSGRNIAQVAPTNHYSFDMSGSSNGTYNICLFAPSDLRPNLNFPAVVAPPALAPASAVTGTKRTSSEAITDEP
jgi:integrase